MPFSVPPIPKPATASRRGAPPHRPGRGRQAPPRWYSFTPPQWHVFSPPLTAYPMSVAVIAKKLVYATAGEPMAEPPAMPELALLGVDPRC